MVEKSTGNRTGASGCFFRSQAAILAAERRKTALKKGRSPEVRDAQRDRPKMKRILFEVLSAAVAAACATFIGWLMAKRSSHDGQDRDR